jgi:hypothetical protein
VKSRAARFCGGAGPRSEHARAVDVDSSRNAIAVTKTMYDADPSNDLDVPVTVA